MRILFRSFLLVSIAFILSQPVLAENHGDDKRPSESPSRAVDKVRIVRQDGETVVKELTEDGIQSTFIDKDNKSHTTAWKFTDFTSEKVAVTDGKGRIIVAALRGKSDDVIKAAKKLGFTVVQRSFADPDLIVFGYDAKKISLEQIQKLYFSSSVRYAEPDAKVEAGGAAGIQIDR
jgi:hypothetical protein